MKVNTIVKCKTVNDLINYLIDCETANPRMQFLHCLTSPEDNSRPKTDVLVLEYDDDSNTLEMK